MPRIESLAPSVNQQGTMYIEARGPIVGTGRVNYENGDKQGHFGIIRRLSNKSTLTVAQRPNETGLGG